MSSSSPEQSIALLRCPGCREKIVVQRARGEIVILQRVLLVKAGQVYGVCPQCRLDVPILEMTYRATSLFISGDSAETETVEQ